MTTLLDTPPATAAVNDRTNETTAAGISWLQLNRHRAMIRKRWPSLIKLPVDDSPFGGLARAGAQPRRVLDVGATDRVWRTPIESRWPDVQYKSLDIDRTNPHDYHDFADVDQTFDLVCCFEVLEHVPPTTAIELLADCVRACSPGGYVVVSVPNVQTPGVQLEFTHQTAYTVMDVGGLLRWHELEVIDAARMCLSSRRRRLLHTTLLAPLHRALKIDFCQSIVVVGRKSK